MALNLCPRCRQALTACLCAATMFLGASDLPERTLFRDGGLSFSKEMASGVSVSSTFNLAPYDLKAIVALMEPKKPPG
jgi:hypothetical protein